MYSKKLQQSGFTIIELMIALAFVSFILLFVVTATVQVMRSYNKGLVTKQINQSGRTITEELSRTARSAWAESVVTDKTANGRFCVGDVAYIWNEPAIVGRPQINNNQFVGGGEVDIVRIKDAAAKNYCDNVATLIPNPTTNVTASNLSNGSIRIVNFQAVQSTDARLLTVSFGVSSVRDNTPVIVDGTIQCPASQLLGSFCAQGDFQTTVYLRNKNGR